MMKLALRDVRKTYDKKQVVHGVNLDVPAGAFVVIVGPSGCGKSTLLRMIAGLEDISDGEIAIDGSRVNEREPSERGCAMVFQNYALYPHMTVAQNIEYPLKIAGVARAERTRRMRETADILDLGDYLDRRPGQLSGGQRQRVAMGRAIVRHPMAFLMDEPLSNLDAKLRVQMRSELKLLNQRLGVTTLYVTHDQVEAMTMGDRVAVLKPVSDAQASNLQQIDNPQRLYDQPANLFVAGFIGSPAMNFLRVDLVREIDALMVRIAGTDISFPAPKGRGLEAHAGGQAIVGIRPEMFLVSNLGKALFHEPIAIAEALGADTFVFFDIPSSPVNINDLSAEDGLPPQRGQTRLVARIPPTATPALNDRLALTVEFDRLHWFDPTTGTAISADRSAI